MKARIFACLALLTLAANAGAGMYKYVGPDGKVVYADRPPVEPTSNVRVFSGGVPRPVAPNERGFVAPREEKPAEKAVADAEPARTPGSDRTRELAPLLPALRTAMDATTLIDRTVDLCIMTLPRAYRRYVAAQDAWKERNGGVTERVNAILDDLVSGDDRLQLERQALEHTATHLQDARTIPKAKRVEWCERKAEEIGSGKLDLANRPAMRALIQYQPR